MLKYYIKFAIRSFGRNKVIFSGSLATLCLGTLCISLLYSYIDNELSMNDFSKKEIENKKSFAIDNDELQSDIYLMLNKDSQNSNWRVSEPSSYWNLDYKKYPEIKNSVQVKRYNEEFKFTYNSKSLYPSGLVVGTTFFKIFDFKLKLGNKQKALNKLNSVVLSEKFSKTLFGDKNPIGESIKIKEVEDGKFNEFFTVTGVVKVPSNSSLTFDYLITDDKKPNKFNRMGCDFIQTIPDFNKSVFIEKLGLEKNKYFQKLSNQDSKFKKYYKKQKESTIGLISLNGVYFNREISVDYIGIFKKFGDKKNNTVIIIILLVILLISVLNFSNLQIVNINSILKQIGIHKVNGAKKKHIFFQKIVDITIIIIIALLLTTISYQLILPTFNTFFKIGLTPSISEILFINSCILAVLGILSLPYPVYIIFKISAIKSLKKKVSNSKYIVGKKIMIIAQYVLTGILLITSIIVGKQLDLLLDKDLGIKSDNIIITKLFYNPPLDTDFKNWSVEKREEKIDGLLSSHQYIKNEILSNTSFISISQGNSLLTPYKKTYKADNESEDFTSVNIINATSDHLKVYDFEMLEGSFLNKTSNDPRISSKNNTVIINEAAKKFWDIKDISTTNILDKGNNRFKITGVIKDFNYEHLSMKPQPLIISLNNKLDADFHIRFHENRVQEGLLFLKALFKNIQPNETFKYSFLSDEIATLYQKEKRLSTIYICFTIIALIISAIGLFTIALYDTQRRIKEVGVRKVNGATIKEIMLMLNKDFIKWVLIAFIIACPITYYAMSKWLENFAYKTALSWWVFAFAGVFTLVIALLTVSWQTYRAATRNPVESLRDE